MALIKPLQTTIIPGSPGQEYMPASTVCTPAPPDDDGGGDVPDGTPTYYYVYVPNDPNDAGDGEVRTVYDHHPGTGYVCDVEPQQYVVWEIVGGVPIGTPVYERRCYWNYD